MASIILTNLQSVTPLSSISDVTYTDLHLDIQGSPTSFTRDIKVDNDLQAIKNSLSNLFSTVPGQKLLDPTYGLNLLQFLFEPVTKTVGTMIGQTILNGIQKYEPRVTILQISVDGDPDQNQYNITLGLQIPAFPATDPLILNTILSQNSDFTLI